jgi:hypothetical protein
MPVTMAAVLQEMRASPEAFLRHYHVVISGGAQTQSGVATFQFADAATTTQGFTTGLSGIIGRTKARPKVRFSKVALPPLANPGVDQFDAHYVAMTQIGDAAATTHHQLPGVGGPDIMLTSQLTGCTFGTGMPAANGSLLVSHIQPPVAAVGTRQDLHNTMANRLGAGGHIFERENQPAGGYGAGANAATIIGVRANNQWRFYAQVWSRAGGANPSQVLSVTPL